MLTRQRRQQMMEAVQRATPAVPPVDNLPGPGAFDGRSDGVEWLKRFELWARCRQLTDDTKMAALQLHLRRRLSVARQRKRL